MQRHRTAARCALRTIVPAAVAVLSFACQPARPNAATEAVEISLPAARAYVERLAAKPASELSDSEVVVLGYLERARIGLGSPFRLIEFALRDPFLDLQQRQAVAFALLARAREGRTYEIDPRVLDLVRLNGVDPRVSTGAHQLALIERIIAIAPSAASGERMVRLGFELARAENTVTASFPSVVSHVAALVADRRRAREDANRLIAAAREERVSPLDLIPSWRAERRFSVETPAMAVLTAAEEEAVATQGPRVAQGIRAIAHRLSGSGVAAALVGSGEAGPQPVLSPEAARRLLEVANRRDYPPQAPISVALMINRDEYVAGAGGEKSEQEARAAFIDTMYNEERFVAGWILEKVGHPGEALRLRLIQLQATVFFRVWNQEQPWFPGDPAPAAKDLIARFGLAGVEFGEQVPERWRPYYRRILGQALVDLQRVLPTTSVRGLTIRFDELPGGRRALALHDPATRTLYLPPRTGAGTLAHEIAHDLDWQLARKRYDSHRGYATDMAVSLGRGDRLAYALSSLAASITQPDSVGRAHDTRPAEVFARGTDWFVAALLAREGRAGGYLTSFQDPALTGYGTTRGPDIGGGAVGSLLEILQRITPVEPAAAEWALEVHGPQRRLTPIELAKALTDAGSDLPAMERFAVIREHRDRALSLLDNASCRMSSAEGLRRLSAAQRSLIEAAAEAAARGAAFEAAREVGEEAGISASRTDAWMAHRLYGAPEPADSALAEFAPALEEIVYHVNTLRAREDAELVDVFGFAPRPTVCGGNPFAIRRFGAAARPPASSAPRP